MLIRKFYLKVVKITFLEQRKSLAVIDANHWYHFNSCTLGGLEIVTASRQELTNAMVADCLAARNIENPPRLIFDVNGHGLSLYARNSTYRVAMKAADVLHADGGFLVTLSRKLKQNPIAERSATTDLFHDFAKAAEKNHLSFYLLGGTKKVNSKCIKQLKAQYPHLNIVGNRNGFFSDSEEISIIEEINARKPDILWVGLGKPLEQICSLKWRSRLSCGWLVTCGGCYNYITGDYPRAPVWMQNHNIEFIHRMITNPRLTWRYLTTSPHALWIALTHRQKDKM
jgi:exopolysaccharide biosynthesis WecB/TagA/CpsF family protein